MRQLDMLQKSGRLHVVGMHQHEFLILRRCARVILAQLFPAQGTVDQAHRNRLALGLAEDQAIAAGELRRFGL